MHDARPITTEAQLRSLIPEPSSRVKLEILDALERHSQHMIALIDPGDFPSMGEMSLDEINPNGKTLNKIGARIFDLASSDHERRRLY